jgi:hypothetical protein
MTAIDHVDAACRGQDPTLWDTDHETHGSLFGRCQKCIAALRICQRCPQRGRCREEATEQQDVYTIRGGWAMVPTARRRKPQRVVAADACEHCRLPVLRRQGERFCSLQCARRQAALTRRPSPVAA